MLRCTRPAPQVRRTQASSFVCTNHDRLKTERTKPEDAGQGSPVLQNNVNVTRKLRSLGHATRRIFRYIDPILQAILYSLKLMLLPSSSYTLLRTVRIVDSHDFRVSACVTCAV